MFSRKDMGFHSTAGVSGLCNLKLFGPDGELKDEREVHNQVTLLFDAHIADALSDIGEAVIGYMGIGTATGGKSEASTDLETLLDLNALTSTTQGAGAADNTVIYIGDWAAADGTGALVEAGIYVGNATGDLMCYADFAVVNKGAADTLQITWTVTISH